MSEAVLRPAQLLSETTDAAVLPPCFAHKSVSGNICESDALLPDPESAPGPTRTAPSDFLALADSDHLGQLLHVAPSPHSSGVYNTTRYGSIPVAPP